ncbi:MAG: FtsX-like permease family protein [Chitinophagales bacterium]|nr:FtsX-like permease family protein [Chitinophagales bacterium]
MKVELFITKRLAAGGGKSFSRFISRIATAAVALSLAVMIVSLAMVNGFQREISNKIFGFWGHVYITQFGFGRSFENNVSITYGQANVGMIRKMPNVARVEGFAYKPCIMKTSDQLDGLVLKGLAQTYDWHFFAAHLVSGQVPTFQKEEEFSRDILISRITARRLQLKVGDDIDLHFLQNSALPQIRRMKVSGIYNTGMEEYDALYALVDIRMIQQLNQWGADEVSGFEVFLKSYESNRLTAAFQSGLDATPINEVAEYINSEVLGPELSAQTIMQVNPNIFDWLSLQNTNKWVILGLMAVVALVNMTTCLLILILERTNMIGILKALGAQDWTIRMIFVYQAVFIVAIGLVIGNAIGIGICLAQAQWGLITLPEESYYVSKAPIDLNWASVAVLNIITLLLCFLVLLFPSWLVSSIAPVKAIRFS